MYNLGKHKIQFLNALLDMIDICSSSLLRYKRINILNFYFLTYNSFLYFGCIFYYISYFCFLHPNAPIFTSPVSFKFMTIAENHNQSKCRIWEPSSNGFLSRILSYLGLREH